MRGFEGAAQLEADLEDLLGWQPASSPEQGAEVLAGDELHRVVDPAVRLADVEDAADCRVRQLSSGPDVREDPKPVLVAGWANNLNGDRRQEYEVVGSLHLAAAAA